MARTHVIIRREAVAARHVVQIHVVAVAVVEVAAMAEVAVRRCNLNLAIRKVAVAVAVAVAADVRAVKTEAMATMEDRRAQCILRVRSTFF
jgi:hypothetical protein